MKIWKEDKEISGAHARCCDSCESAGWNTEVGLHCGLGGRRIPTSLPIMHDACIHAGGIEGGGGL